MNNDGHRNVRRQSIPHPDPVIRAAAKDAVQLAHALTSYEHPQERAAAAKTVARVMIDENRVDVLAATIELLSNDLVTTWSMIRTAKQLDNPLDVTVGDISAVGYYANLLRTIESNAAG